MFIVSFIKKIIHFVTHAGQQTTKSFSHLQYIAYEESAVFMYNHLATAVLYTDKKKFRDYCLDQILPEGLFLEFGVFKAVSTHHFSQYLQQKNDVRTIYGFDAFQGLSTDRSGTHMEEHTFDLQGNIPKVPDNVSLVVGWVEDTLPGFIQGNITDHEKIAFLHMDLDIYSPTRYVLEHIAHFFQVGTLIVFDELLGYPGFKYNELQALEEVISPVWEYEFIGFCEPKGNDLHVSPYVRAALKIVGKKKII